MPLPDHRPGRLAPALPVQRSGSDGPAAAPATPAPATPAGVPGGVLTDRDAPVFDVHLANYSGPFDLLLGLISRRRLEITEVSLAAVTDEFIAHLRRLLAAADADTSRGGAGEGAALGQASGFLVVAATLLELKATRLLPSPEGADLDADDLALVEARDLLFARLLQHRAYGRVAGLLGERLAAGALGVPRPGGTPAPDAAAAGDAPAAPLATTPDRLAALAARALSAGALAASGRPPQRVDVDHLHAPTVSVPEQVALLRERLCGHQALHPGTPLAFEDLHALLDGDGSGPHATVVVGRFLALLELYRRGEVDLRQARPEEPLLVSWRDAVVAVVDLVDVTAPAPRVPALQSPERHP